jgi:hypothetical protein
MLLRRTELSVTTNVSAENETATFAKPLLGAGVLVVRMFLVIVKLSFLFFSVSLL